MSGWPRVPLRRIFRIVNGGTPTPAVENWDGGIHWATPVDVGRAGMTLVSTERTITPEGLRSGSRSVPEGSIILSTRAPIGYVVRTAKAAAFNQGCRGLVPLDAATDVRYFAYQLGHLSETLQARGQGSTFRELSTDSLAQVLVTVPGIEEQRRIADFLDVETATIDDLVSKRRQLITLARERLDAHRESVLTTHPDVSWVPLQRLTDPRRPIVYGIVQAGEEVPDGVPYIKTGDLANLRPELLSRTSPEIDLAYRRARVHPGDIVIAMRASIGLAVAVPQSLPVANLTQGTARIAAGPGISTEWLMQALACRSVQEQCSVRAVGTTFKTLNIWDLRRILIPTASTDSLRAALAGDVASEADRVLRLVGSMGAQAERLVERRQALITAAVTGELDVATARGVA
jgi:type I restriction enzyme S subunit